MVSFNTILFAQKVLEKLNQIIKHSCQNSHELYQKIGNIYFAKNLLLFHSLFSPNILCLSGCLFVWISDHNSWTSRLISLKFWLENSVKPREYSWSGLKILIHLYKENLKLNFCKLLLTLRFWALNENWFINYLWFM